MLIPLTPSQVLLQVVKEHLYFTAAVFPVDSISLKALKKGLLAFVPVVINPAVFLNIIPSPQLKYKGWIKDINLSTESRVLFI